jgi:hypothetical protein
VVSAAFSAPRRCVAPEDDGSVLKVSSRRRGDDAEQERQAPAPRIDDLLGQQHVDERCDDRAERETERGGREIPTGKECAGAIARIFDEQRRARTKFAAGRKTLDQPRAQHDQRCEKARRRVGRRARNQRATERHQHDREHHRFLAPHAIRVGADHNAAERPHHEAHAEYTDRQQELVHRRRGREEQLADLDREETVDREIVVFERRTERGGGDDLSFRQARFLQCERCHVTAPERAERRYGLSYTRKKEFSHTIKPLASSAHGARLYGKGKGKGEARRRQ